MLQTLLTLMLFIMPFLISKKEVPFPGVHTGLWISLFFWGRIHPMFSILVFGCSLLYFLIQKKNIPSAETLSWSPFAPALWIPRSGARPLTGFLAIMMVFCAFGNVCNDFGITMNMTAAVQETALLLGFLGSLTGPVFFGLLCDKTGPFAAFMTLVFLGLLAVGITAWSVDFPYFFPLGSFLMQSVIGGVFTLTPQILLQFYGRPQLSSFLPILLLFLAGLWTTALGFYTGADALPQDYLLAMTFLLIMAAPLASRAWRRRLAVL